ncbi:hypothetical protein CW713_05670 [Methanophagales archaeon]|nr:MAG: hypothetical protein CW713_05670 [Methanophagales archaeon]
MDLFALITVDCLRYDLYKSLLKIFDNRLGKISFSNCYSLGPYTAASFPGLFSGLPTFILGYHSLKEVANRKLLTEYLSKAGFKCFGISGNNVFLTRYFGYHKGFEKFIDYVTFYENDNKNIFTKNIRILRRIFLSGRLKILGKISFISIPTIAFITSNKILEPVLNCIREINTFISLIKKFRGGKVKRIFVWLHLMDLHTPYSIYLRNLHNMHRIFGIRLYETGLIPINRFIIKSAKELYYASFNFLLYTLKNFIHYLQNFSERYGYNLTIIITGDHGEELGEHNALGHQGIIYYNYSIPHIYNELIKVPLIIASSKLDSSEERKSLCSHIDLLPTILSILNVKHKAIKFLPGINLIDMDRKKFYVFSEAEAIKIRDTYYGRKIALIAEDEIKAIFNPITGLEIYDLKKDPYEKEKLNDRDIRKDFEKLLKMYLRFKRKIELKYKLLIK